MEMTTITKPDQVQVKNLEMMYNNDTSHQVMCKVTVKVTEQMNICDYASMMGVKAFGMFRVSPISNVISIAQIWSICL